MYFILRLIDRVNINVRLNFRGFSSKAEALETFRQTELGSRMVQDLEARETALQDATNQHAEALQNANDFFKQVFNKQAEFDAIQQERHSKGDEYDTSGNIIVPKKEKDLLIELRVRDLY